MGSVRRADRRIARGFTLIEVLAVFAIVGIVLALILPAVNSARDAARRAQCASNLRQILIAIHAYHASEQLLPTVVAPFEETGRWNTLSGFARILPYLDAGNSWDVLNFEQDARNPESVEGMASKTWLSLAACPADPLTARGCSSYRFSCGIDAYAYPGSNSLSGAFTRHTFRRTADFVDGLAQTAGMAEKLIGSGGKFSPLRDRWDFLSSEPTMDWIPVCSQVQGSPTFWNSIRGRNWLYGPELFYHHLSVPNSLLIDCGFTAAVGPAGLAAARSMHSGGVEVGKMDGSVAFVGNSIDRRVWWAFGTINGGESVAVP